MNNIKQISPQLAQIKNYTPALKIGDKYFVNGIGGNFVPSGAGSMDFYKCASVDTTNKTWTGYKLLEQENNGYIISNSITENLSYIKTAPIINKIYSYNGALYIGSYLPGAPMNIPNDYIFYDTMTEISSADTLGTQINQSGTSIVSDNIISRNVLNFSSTNNSKYLTSSLSDISETWTYSIWARMTTTTGPFYILALGFNTMIQLDSDGVTVVNWDGSSGNNKVGSFQPGLDWHNIIIEHTSYSAGKIFVDGISLYDGLVPWSDSLSDIGIGYHRYNNNSTDGKASSVRLYNRILTDAEIIALSSEFTPTQS